MSCVEETSCNATKLRPADRVRRPLRTVAGRYALESVVGAGATSLVYRAHCLDTRHRVAIKLQRLEHSRVEAAVDDFLVEGCVASRVTHPNVVRVLDRGLDDGQAWLAMELVGGETLDRRLTRLGRLRWSSVRRIILQLCSALDAAHSLGIVHHDIKPHNCICVAGAEQPDHIKLIDFGIASSPDTRAEDAVCTRWMGTPAYMAPERVQRVGDPRSDVYSTGVLMYELLTGTLPFDRPTTQAMLLDHASAPVQPPSMRAPGCCPPAVDRVVLRALAKRPAERFESARAFAEALCQLPRTYAPGDFRSLRWRAPAQLASATRRLMDATVELLNRSLGVGTKTGALIMREDPASL